MVPVLEEYGKSYLSGEDNNELLFRLITYAVACAQDNLFKIDIIVSSLTTILRAFKSVGLDLSQRRVYTCLLSLLIKIGGWKDNSSLISTDWCP